MKTYIALVRYTEKGIEGLKKRVPTQNDLSKLCEACGASLLQSYWVAGRFDAVLICQVPDNKTLSGMLDRLDNCRTELLSVMSAELFGELVRDRPIPKTLRGLVSKALRQARHI